MVVFGSWLEFELVQKNNYIRVKVHVICKREEQWPLHWSGIMNRIKYLQKKLM